MKIFFYRKSQPWPNHKENLLLLVHSIHNTVYKNPMKEQQQNDEKKNERKSYFEK